MTVTSGFFNSVSGDRLYDALQLSQFLDGILTDGILPGLGTSMIVTSGGGLIANIGVGKAWFKNTYTYNDAVYPFTLDTADPILPRIDVIVLVIDLSVGVRQNSFKVIKGTPASSPIGPSPISSPPYHYEYRLAECRVNAGATTIASFTNYVGTGQTPYAGLAVSLTVGKSAGTDIAAGTDDIKYVTAKAIRDALYIAGTFPNNGWVPDNNTWTYSSIDGPTVVVSVNADVTAKVSVGMKLRYFQTHSMSGFFPFDSNSTPTVGAWTIVDTAMTYTAGKYSNAATFNGTTSNINVTDQLTWRPASNIPFTYGFWVKASAPGSASTIFQTFSANTAYAGLAFQVSTAGKLIVIVGANTGTVANLDYTTMTSKASVADGLAFHHVVITYKLNYLQIYIDGVLDTAGYCLTPAFAATNYVRFGCGNNTGTNVTFFNGQIDDFFVFYNVVIDQETIVGKYNSGVTLGAGSWNVFKKSIITGVGAFSAGVTLVTMYEGTDQMMAAGTMQSPCYSNDESPFSFNRNPDKWSVTAMTINAPTKTSPTLQTFYGGSQLTPAGPSVSVPIGAWLPQARASVRGVTAATINAISLKATLSTANNSESNPEYTGWFQTVNPTAAAWSHGFQYALAGKLLLLSTKTTFFLNIGYWVTASSFSSILIESTTISYITFVCAYL